MEPPLSIVEVCWGYRGTGPSPGGITVPLLCVPAVSPALKQAWRCARDTRRPDLHRVECRDGVAAAWLCPHNTAAVRGAVGRCPTWTEPAHWVLLLCWALHLSFKIYIEMLKKLTTNSEPILIGVSAVGGVSEMHAKELKSQISVGRMKKERKKQCERNPIKRS